MLCATTTQKTAEVRVPFARIHHPFLQPTHSSADVLRNYDMYLDSKEQP